MAASRAKTVAATLCYVKQDGRTLMLHRNKKDGDVHRGKWNGLGGKLDAGESPDECVVREVREESGLIGECPEGSLEWVLDAKIAELPLWEGDRVFLPWLDAARFFSAKFVYREGRLAGHDVSFY